MKDAQGTEARGPKRDENVTEFLVDTMRMETHGPKRETDDENVKENDSVTAEIATDEGDTAKREDDKPAAGTHSPTHDRTEMEASNEFIEVVNAGIAEACSPKRNLKVEVENSANRCNEDGSSTDDGRRGNQKTH